MANGVIQMQSHSMEQMHNQKNAMQAAAQMAKCGMPMQQHGLIITQWKQFRRKIFQCCLDTSL